MKKEQWEELEAEMAKLGLTNEEKEGVEKSIEISNYKKLQTSSKTYYD